MQIGSRRGVPVTTAVEREQAERAGVVVDIARTDDDTARAERGTRRLMLPIGASAQPRAAAANASSSRAMSGPAGW